MRTSFVDFFATDGVKLQGLLFETEHEKKTIVIHVHGMTGSFYENSFSFIFNLSIVIIFMNSVDGPFIF